MVWLFLTFWQIEGNVCIKCYRVIEATPNISISCNLPQATLSNLLGVQKDLSALERQKCLPLRQKALRC